MTKFSTTSAKLAKIKECRDEAEKARDLKLFTKSSALVALFENRTDLCTIAEMLGKSIETIRNWVKEFIERGVSCVQMAKKFLGFGRQPKLSESEKKNLKKMISVPPTDHGYLSGCWNAAIVLDLISREFKVEYSVKYIPQLLRSIGLSYQKARFAVY